MSRNKLRIAAVILVATTATLFRYAEYVRAHGRHGDFGEVWFGARSLLHGIDPYPLVGPGRVYDWPWGLYYPATAIAAVLPLGLLPEVMATMIFVWISAALLTFGLTARGWERMWILPSAAFLVAARAAQWSPLYSAAYVLPPVALILSAKPTLGLAVVAGARSLITIRFAAIGTILLLALSFVLIPSWPQEWIRAVQATELRPAVAWPGGVLVLLALVRWRQPEARLLVALACVPSTASWYEALPLLLVGQTKRECQLLSLISSAGYIAQGFFLTSEGFIEIPRIRILMLLFCYLPALVVVLRRSRLQG